MPHTYLHRRLHSFRCAFAGLRLLLRSQPHARLHALATAAVIAAGLLHHVTASDWRWLLLATALVWIAEAFNSALELTCDAITRAHHPIIGQAKDLAAAAVFLTALFALAIAFSIFTPALCR